MSQPIVLHVNGEAHRVAPGTTLGALLSELGVRREAVAVALNLEVVPKGRIAGQALAAGDKVEVVRAVGGG